MKGFEIEGSTRKYSETDNRMVYVADRPDIADEVLRAMEGDTRTIKRLEKKCDETIKRQTKEMDAVRAQGMSLAKEYLNELRQRIGWNVIHPSDLKIVFLDDESFGVAYRSLGGSEEGAVTSAGFVCSQTEYVFIRDRESRSKLLEVMTMSHELIHGYVDLTTVVYGVKKNLPTRKGLAVRKVEREVGGEASWAEYMGGMLLNELGNYLAEWKFMQRVKRMEPYAEELRNYMGELRVALGAEELDDATLIKVPFNNDGEVVVLMNTELLAAITYGQGGGQKRLLNNTAIYMQIALELDTACKEVGGEELLDLMTEAKISPTVQRELQERIDGVFGDGSYTAMKGYGYDVNEALNLLVQIQSLLYDKAE